ncbi:MAG: hypothetical protein D6724_03905 [Armatimonadetes bacterium]|nr:MAG: hypothetical protein D6724_03905 [Armatimonadota bacterium]
MTILAIIATTVVMVQGSTPPSVPKDGIPQGKGFTLLDEKFSQVKSVTPDSSVPGGRRVTMRWLWWTVYVRPTGNSRITTSTTCKNDCTKPGAHGHPGECSVGTCAVACEVKSHDVEIESATSSAATTSVRKAVERAVTVMDKIVAEAGVSYGPFSAKVEGTHERTETRKESWEQTISATIQSSVGGSSKVSLGHFNKEPCGKETRYYGTREYELRLLCQVVEQDYYSEDWIIGGTGVLPGSRLKATGKATFVGRISDEQIGTYQIPSDEPVASKKIPLCRCSKPVTTPPPGGDTTPPPGGDQSPPAGGGGQGAQKTGNLPRHVQRFVVTPTPDESLYVSNPFNTKILCAYADVVVEIEPGEQKLIDTDQTNTSVLLSTAAGAALFGIIIDGSGRSEQVQVSPVKAIQQTIEPIEDVAPVVSVQPEQTVDLGWPATDAPRDTPNVPQPETESPLKAVLTGGVPLGTINALGDSSGVIQAVGSFPSGSEFSLAEGTKRVACNTLFEVREGETVKSAYFYCPDVAGFERPQLTVTNADGETIATSPPMEVVRPQIQSNLEPRDGPPGSQATLVIDCREVLAMLSLEGMGDADEFDVVLDYSNSGGASGPERVPMDASGIVRVAVQRGSAPGGFQVGIGIARRAGVSLLVPALCCSAQ